MSIQSLATRLRGRIFPRKIDLFLVSFPKCGRTWLRMMLGTAGSLHCGVRVEDPTDLQALHRLSNSFPAIEPTHDRMAFQFSEAQMTFDRATFKGKKVIFLARDPRDVMVSFFYHQKHRRNLEYNLPIFEKPEDMIEAEKGGLPSLLAFYNMWVANTKLCDDVLWVYYEDMHENAESQLRRIFDFVDLNNVEDAYLKKAVEQSQFDRMRAIESNQEVKNFRLTPADPNNTDTYKTRKGLVGGYRDEMDAASVERMNAVISNKLDPFFHRYLE